MQANPGEQALRSIQKRRTANFRDDETRVLIQLWGSPEIQNKLFLTHRKAPVMRTLAATMQQRGFYRTADEIKTRIRNLKCLYHRIKRSMSSGTGIGTVDPDWPHFKAMDAILSKEYPRKLTDRILEEHMAPKIELKLSEEVRVKQEMDEIDIDDNDSWATNDSANSEYDDENSKSPGPVTAPMVTITKPPPPVPVQQCSIQVRKTASLQGPQLPQLRLQTIGANPQVKNIPLQPAIKPVPALTQVTQNGQKPGFNIPFLIINPNNAQDKNSMKKTINTPATTPPTEAPISSSIIRELIDLQKKSLKVQTEHLEVEKQRLEFDRVLGTQIATMLPMLSGVLQRLAFPENQELLNMKYDVLTSMKRKRSASEDADVVKHSKTQKTVLEGEMNKYMLLDDGIVQPMNNRNETQTKDGHDDHDKQSDVDIESMNGDVLEPDVVIEQLQDDDDDEGNLEDDDDDDDHEKLVIETRRSPRARKSK